MFEAVEKDLLPTKIVNSLLALIKQKRLLPGNKLPPERELAQIMNVSRPSLRAALQTLATMNVIDIHPGSGAYVSELDPERLVQHLDFIFALDDSSVLQLFDVRRTLELRTAALAARAITAEEITELEADLVAWDRASNDDAREAADREFHQHIAAASRNPLLYRFVSIVTQLGKESRCRSYRLPRAIDNTRQEHRAIIDALRAQDVDRAEQAMLSHLQEAEKFLRQMVTEEQL
jgi:GntR family transcriptional repressor for pyruvate dehydrogenase complex